MIKRGTLRNIALGIAGFAATCASALIWDAHRGATPDAYYVALGSSFAAGLGLGPRAPGSPIVSQRSVNGYPQQVARLLKVPSFTDMTSSGATVRHVLYGGQMMLGPQVDALGPNTRLVTLTVGGNDIGYVGDLVAMGWRNKGGIIGAAVALLWKGAKPIAERDFPALDANLRATLREIQRRSPNARIMVVTYPTILPPAGTCPSLSITAAQAAHMRLVGEKLAEVTRDAAHSMGIAVVDVATLSADHNACSRQPWVNGISPKSGAAFHPTFAGARATAQAIAKQLAES